MIAVVIACMSYDIVLVLCNYMFMFKRLPLDYLSPSEAQGESIDIEFDPESGSALPHTISKSYPHSCMFHVRRHTSIPPSSHTLSAGASFKTAGSGGQTSGPWSPIYGLDNYL